MSIECKSLQKGIKFQMANRCHQLSHMNINQKIVHNLEKCFRNLIRHLSSEEKKMFLGLERIVSKEALVLSNKNVISEFFSKANIHL